MSYETLKLLDNRFKNIKLSELKTDKIKEGIMNIYFSTQDKIIKKELKKLL